MKTDTFNIEHLVTIKVPALKVYEALTTRHGLGEVWTTELRVKAEIDFVNEFVFDKETDRMKITELNPGKKVEWLVIESDPQWIGTVISFELSEKNNLTTVVLKQQGWKEVTDFYRFCNYHWGWFLYSLKHYCENGEGFPYQRRKF
jgi:uncharacterized protein YndB with AHSA1/START domain